MALQTSQNVTNILVGHAKLWIAPIGTTLPDDDTLAYGAAWPSGWVYAGYTTEGAKAAYKQDKMDVEIQEAMAPVDRRVAKEEFTLETVLAEFIVTNLDLAWGGVGTVSTVAPTTGVTGKDIIKSGGKATLVKKMIGLEGSYLDANGVELPVRIIVYRATAVAGGELEFVKDKITGVPFRVEGLEDMSKTDGQRLFQITKITAPAT